MLYIINIQQDKWCDWSQYIHCTLHVHTLIRTHIHSKLNMVYLVKQEKKGKTFMPDVDLHYLK